MPHTADVHPGVCDTSPPRAGIPHTETSAERPHTPACREGVGGFARRLRAGTTGQSGQIWKPASWAAGQPVLAVPVSRK